VTDTQSCTALPTIVPGQPICRVAGQNNAFFINAGAMKLSAMTANKTICLAGAVLTCAQLVSEDRWQ
jgi:hypothetical protein